MRIDWEEKYCVGVERFDNQHKKLFSLIADLYKAIKERRGAEVQGEFLEALVDYTYTHLAAEEKILEETSYPEFEGHKKEHEVMKAKAREYHERYKSGTTIVSMALLEFVNDWWRNHIVTVDKKYGSFLTGKGIE